MGIFTYLGQFSFWSYHLSMKRIILVCLISAGFIYQILPQPEGEPQIDQIRTRMAAARSRPDEVKPSLHRITAALVEEQPESEVNSISENAVTAELEPDTTELAHADDVPWEDIKTGWRNDLRDFLIDTDSERGEEIYNAYLEESESFEAEIDALAKEQEKAGIEAKQDFENVIGQLEVRHEEKLKEILGNFYSEVTDRHQQYNTSIQYLNRSDADIVGVSL
jgi:hypothetical protein